MFHKFKSIIKLKLICVILSLEGTKCSIDGTFSVIQENGANPVENPCNPLYWYPKNIPEYCHFKKMPIPPTDSGPDKSFPIPVPIPVPAPVPILPPPFGSPHVMPPNPPPPLVVPQPIMPLPMPLPYGIPLAPTNPMVPIAGIPLSLRRAFPMAFPSQYSPPYPPSHPPLYPPPHPPSYPPPHLPLYASPYPSPVAAFLSSPNASLYPSPYQMPPAGRIGMVPGISGLVSRDGGINIMPFSDVYSDMLENHKQKMIRRRLQKFLDEYERPPWKIRRKTKPKESHWQNDID